MTDETRPLEDFKILFATPHSYPTIHKQWFSMYEQLVKPRTSRLYMDPNLPLDLNRNNAVKEALKGDFEYVFFIDHDNILPSDTLVRLLGRNAPVVGCLYFERKYPHLPLIYTFEQDFKTVRVEYEYPKGLVQVDVIGLGCSLIHTDIFKQLDEPWFAYEHAGQKWGTEDIAFFHKLKELDIPVYIDTEHTVGHLTEYTIEEADWLYYKNAYLAEVDKTAKSLGTNMLLLDKNKGKLVKSPSAKD